MAKASNPVSPSETSRNMVIATEIVALINSRPVSPRADEIAAILAASGTPPLSTSHPALRARWDAAAAAHSEACARLSRMFDEDEGRQDTGPVEDEMSQLQDRLDDCARDIFRAPARTAGDVRLVADAAFSTLWSGVHLADAGADAHMAGGPHHAVGRGICAEALAALFKAVRDVLPAGSARDVIGRGEPDDAQDGEPAKWAPIDIDLPADFAATHFGVAQLALQFLQHDHVGAQRAVKRLLDDAHGHFDRSTGDVMLGLLHDWEDTSRKLKALAEMVATAHTRAVVSFAAVAPDHPDVSKLRVMDLDDDERVR